MKVRITLSGSSVNKMSRDERVGRVFDPPVGDTAAKLHFFESGLDGTLMDIQNPVIFGDQGHDADRLGRRHDDIVAGPALAFCVTNDAGQKRDPGRGTSASEALKDGQGFSMAGDVAL